MSGHERVPPSAEAERMARAERARWLTVAEGHRAREEWRGAREALDAMMERFDGCPDDPAAAVAMVVALALVADGLAQKAVAAAERINGLQEGGSDVG